MRRVLLLIYDPLVGRNSDRTLTRELGWYDPDRLATDYAADVLEASHGLLDYRVVAREVRQAFLPLADGHLYDAATYLRCWHARAGFHQPEGVDYQWLWREHHVVERLNAGEIDDVWCLAYPWSGFHESIMCGPGAFWCNSAPVDARDMPAGQPRPRRRFITMGFNYEREVGCMLEDLGHQAESILAQVFRDRHGAADLWERFTRYDKIAPGRASAGNVHFAPNSEQDYDWGNRRAVSSDCDDWLEFPHLTGRRRMVDCRDWGNGDMRAHHLWWFRRIPHAPGATDGIAHNWWRYIGDPDEVR